jgi:hypothetical protein
MAINRQSPTTVRFFTHPVCTACTIHLLRLTWKKVERWTDKIDSALSADMLLPGIAFAVPVGSLDGESRHSGALRLVLTPGRRICVWAVPVTRR